MGMVKSPNAILIAIVASTVLSVPLITAFGAHPYVGGFRDRASPTTGQAVAMETSFTGTSLSGIPSTTPASSIFGILSTAGSATSTPTVPSGYVYQSFVSLQNTGNIKGNAEVYSRLAPPSGPCDPNEEEADPTPIVLVSSTRYPDLIKIAHSIGFADVQKTTLRFNFHMFYTTNPTVEVKDIFITKSSYGGDPSNYFLIGDHEIDSDTMVKFTQFGVEKSQSNTPIEGWEIQTKNMLYTSNGGTNIYFSEGRSRSLDYKANENIKYNSWLSYTYNPDSVCGMPVGTTQEDNAGADYNLKPGVSVPENEVRWFHTTNTAEKIVRGTILWN